MTSEVRGHPSTAWVGWFLTVPQQRFPSMEIDWDCRLCFFPSFHGFCLLAICSNELQSFLAFLSVDGLLNLFELLSALSCCYYFDLSVFSIAMELSFLLALYHYGLIPFNRRRCRLNERETRW